MSSRRPPIALTGLGVVAPLGADADAVWQMLAAGRTAIAPLAWVKTPALSSNLAGQLPRNLREELQPRQDDLDPCVPLARAAARQAWRSAGLDREGPSPDRVAIVLGTSATGLTLRGRYETERDAAPARRRRWLVGSLPQNAACGVAEELGIEGPRLTFATACTSSTLAMGHAIQLLAAGQADLVLAGGVEWLVEELVAGFSAIGAMSSGPCAPFSQPFGMCLGEGAGFVVLERAKDAEARGAEILGALSGFGFAMDGYHSTSPEPTGRGMSRAIEAAIADARLTPEDIDHFDAHGTGTEANDAAEGQAFARVFGLRAEQVTVSASKSSFGHALGASGVLELITLILARRHGAVPATANVTTRRPGAPPALVTGHPLQREARHVVSHSAAFGGSYAALVTSDRPFAREERTQPEPVLVLGWGALLAPEGEESVAEPSLSRALDGLVTRGWDRLTALVIAATRLALDHAGLKIRSRPAEGCVACDRIGLFAGGIHLSDEAADRFWSRSLERGYHRAPGPAFSRLVLNAPAGVASRLLELHGPLSVVAQARGAGLSATALAYETLRQRDDVDVLVVTSAFEIGRAARDEHLEPVTLAESAGAVVLARASWAAGAGLSARVRLREARLGGPSQAPRQVEGVSRAEPGAVFAADREVAALWSGRPGAIEDVSAQVGHSGALDMIALARACDHVRDRSEVAVVQAGDDRASTACVLLTPIPDDEEVPHG